MALDAVGVVALAMTTSQRLTTGVIGRLHPRQHRRRALVVASALLGFCPRPPPLALLSLSSHVPHDDARRAEGHAARARPGSRAGAARLRREKRIVVFHAEVF